VYVGIKHKNEPDKIYYFKATAEIIEHLKVGMNALCNTRKGLEEGEVVSFYLTSKMLDHSTIENVWVVKRGFKI
jgi:hypothetical protein